MDLVTRTSFDPMDVRKGDQVVVLPGASLWWPANPGFRISTVWIAAVCIVQGVIDESAEAIELGYDPEPPAVWIVAKWGNISFSHKWSENFLNNTHVDFLSKRKISYTIVVVLMVL